MNKINQLIQKWPKGTIKSAKELKMLGYSPQILQIYSNSKWISLLTRGAYKLYNDDVDWLGGLYGIQRSKMNTFHVGGMTALKYSGILDETFEGTKIEIFGSVKDKLPAWFAKQYWMKNINTVKTDFIKYTFQNYFSLHNVGNFEIEISVSELAALELLYLVPKFHYLEEADEIFTLLSNLNAEVLQSILERCDSVKVKRMFLFLAEKHNHNWLEELNTERIYLGMGKRVIVKGGVFNNKYNITIPKGLNLG